MEWLGDIGVALNGVVLWLLDVVADIDAVPRTLLAFVALLLETSVLVGLVVPGDTIALIAATAVASPVEYVALIVALIAGATAGQSLGFWLGRWIGPAVERSRLGRWIGEKNWQLARGFVERRGGIAVFVSRFLPVLHSLTPLTVGMGSMRFGRFLLWSIPATVIWSVAYVSVGTFAAQSFRAMLDELKFAGFIFVAVIAVFLIIVALVKKALMRQATRGAIDDGDAGAAPNDVSD